MVKEDTSLVYRGITGRKMEMNIHRQYVLTMVLWTKKLESSLKNYFQVKLENTT